MIIVAALTHILRLHKSTYFMPIIQTDTYRNRPKHQRNGLTPMYPMVLFFFHVLLEFIAYIPTHSSQRHQFRSPLRRCASVFLVRLESKRNNYYKFKNYKNNDWFAKIQSLELIWIIITNEDITLIILIYYIYLLFFMVVFKILRLKYDMKDTDTTW